MAPTIEEEKIGILQTESAELGIYFVVWISHSILAFLLATKASWNVGHWLDHWLEPSSYSSALSMDNSDVELKLFRRSLPNALGAFVINSAVFRLVLQLPLSKNGRSLLLIPFWFALNAYLASVQSVLLAIFCTFAVLSITLLTGCQLFAWAIAILAISKVSEWAPFSTDPSKYYREFNLYLYSAIKAINLSIFMLRNRSAVRFGRELAMEFLEYLLYPPFSTALIVLFEDFQRQFRRLNVKIERLQIRSVIWRAFRLFFWLFVLDFLLHVSRVNAFFNSPFTLLEHLGHYEVASIAYVVGHLFHLKYFLIFGLPSLFASIDGFQPPGPPICIARVAKYSQMWRYFDRGLYHFLREQLYIPLMGLLTFVTPLQRQNGTKLASVLRHFVPMCAVFAFVLIWHGLSSNYCCWVCLSATALSIERIGRIVPFRRNFLGRICPKCSEATFVRLKAAWMLFTVIPGIFGVFFFLGLNGVGAFIFRSILSDGLWHIFALQAKPSMREERRAIGKEKK
uniref:Protein-cysteine N-palmitoyltransferase HHAT-like protein n=1 Tax=Globodera pallida TaxID=36090 RepID=A0A183BXZ5_GLOPA